MKKLIFDFDGTIADSMKCWANKMIHILEKRNISYPDDIVKTITPLGDKGTAEYFIRQFNLTESVEALIAEMDEYAMPEYQYNIQAKRDVVETLCELKKCGYSLNVLTASPHKMLDVCLKRLEIFDLFDNVWSCDDFLTTKSDVNIYYMAAECLHVKTEDCVFLDDNYHALLTAKKSGMNIIGVYDESSEDDRTKIQKISGKYIDTFKELIQGERIL